MSKSNHRPTSMDESYTGERRVTVDLDDARPFNVVRACRYLTRSGAHEVEARVSAGDEGFHVRAWFDDDDLDAGDVEELRLAAGDHVRRVEMDRAHTIKPGQVLFSRKHDDEAGEWHGDPWRAVDDLFRRSDRFDLDGFGFDKRGWPRFPEGDA